MPARWGLPLDRAPARRERSWLIAIAIATVVAWQTEFGSMVLYPFTLLATWFHEMGHGLAGAMLGGDFLRLVMFPDGSGFAEIAMPVDSGRVARALTAAAGLMGPAIAGAILIAGSRSPRATRGLLLGLGALLIVSVVVWVRAPAGWVVLPAFALAAIGAALSRRAQLRRFVIELFGVQAAISVWRDLGYLFSEGATVGGRPQLSDSGAIAEALLLPYWFWGALITLAVVVLISAALRFATAAR